MVHSLVDDPCIIVFISFIVAEEAPSPHHSLGGFFLEHPQDLKVSGQRHHAGLGGKVAGPHSQGHGPIAPVVDGFGVPHRVAD